MRCPKRHRHRKATVQQTRAHRDVRNILMKLLSTTAQNTMLSCVVFVSQYLTLPVVWTISQIKPTASAIATNAKKLYQTLVDMTKKIGETIQQSKNNLLKMQGCYDDAMNNVQQIRKEMNDIMNMLESKIRTQAEQFKSANAEKMNSTVEQCNRFLKEIDAVRTQFEKKKETKQECNLFIEMKRSNEKLRVFQRKLEDFQENNKVTDYAFDRSGGMWDLLNKTSTYGKLVQRHQSSPSPRWKTVNLERGSFGFGFSIVGGAGSQYGSKGGDVPIFEANVLPQSPAFKNDLLKRGHQILSVNGISLEGLTHDEAASILKNAKKSVILKVMDKQYTSCECAGKGRCLHCLLH